LSRSKRAAATTIISEEEYLVMGRSPFTR